MNSTTINKKFQFLNKEQSLLITEHFETYRKAKETERVDLLKNQLIEVNKYKRHISNLEENFIHPKFINEIYKYVNSNSISKLEKDIMKIDCINREFKIGFLNAINEVKSELPDNFEEIKIADYNSYSGFDKFRGF